MRKSVFKWWWGWNPTKIENYLEQMAKEGWKLVDASFGFILFTFERSSSQSVKFAFDYQNKVKSDYLTIIEDTGWSLVNRSAGWLLWKIEYSDTRPELMTDTQSLIDRNNRLLVFLIAMFALQIPMLLLLFSGHTDTNLLYTSKAYRFIYLLLVSIMVYGVSNLVIRNKNLKSNNHQ